MNADRPEARTSALGPCSARVAEVLDRAASTVPEPVRASLESLITGLGEPLRVAITGRVSSGKSTIVNALLRQRIAPTDVSECTRYVTAFSFGVPERVEVVARSGVRLRVRLDEHGRLPVRLPDLGGEVVDHLEVFLSNDSLRSMTLIDTPGLSSTNDDISSLTTELLAIDRASRQAISGADALVLVLGGEFRADDAEFLDAYHRLFGGIGASAVNTVAIVNKVDLFADERLDPVADAQSRCRDLSTRLTASVAGVLPLIGLLAETAEAATLTNRELDVLQRAARADERTRSLGLLSVDRALRSSLFGEDPEQRAELLDKLDLVGARLLLTELADSPLGDGEAIELLRRRSGLPALRQLLDQELGTNADALKAAWALTNLERLAYRLDPATRLSLVDLLDSLQVDPVLHRVRELGALQRLVAEGARLSFRPAVVAELASLLRVRREDQQATAVTAEQAAAGAARWKSIANDPASGATERMISETAARAYELRWMELMTS